MLRAFALPLRRAEAARPFGRIRFAHTAPREKGLPDLLSRFRSPAAQQASSRFEKGSARFGAVLGHEPRARSGLSPALPFFFAI